MNFCEVELVESTGVNGALHDVQYAADAEVVTKCCYFKRRKEVIKRILLYIACPVEEFVKKQ